MSKEPAVPRRDPKSPLGNMVTPAEFQVKDVVRRSKGTALENQYNYDLVEPMQYLYVKVVKAQILAAKGADITSDPYVKVSVLEVSAYVKVSVLEVSAQTEVIHKDLNPEWNQVFAFSKDKLRGQLLDISLWDADGDGAHRFLGALPFLLEEIPSRKPPESLPEPLWYKLEERPEKTRVKGDLMMALWMGTQADEAFPDAWYPDTGGYAHLRSRVYLTPDLRYLRVFVIEAKDLYQRDADSDRLLEPTVGINLGPAQSKRLRGRGSFAEGRGPNPVWDSDLMFVAAEPFNELLVVTVTDRVSPSKEEVIGVARISIGEVPLRLDFRQQLKSSWFDLEDKGVCRGRIHLRLQFEEGYHVLDESPDYSSCVKPTAKKLWKPSQGTLELGLIGARNLLPMHLNAGERGVTDAYCVAKYGQKWIQTSTIIDNYSPKWNVQHSWKVYDPCTVLTIGVFDNRRIDHGIEAKAARVKDTPIGKVRIRLSNLEANRVYTNAYPLLVVTASGIKKMGELELSVRFSCTSTVSVLRAYLQPPLPAMHYFVPIETSDLENLRIGAMNLVASRLARFEPPLRQEVVQFILDTESHGWSLRRSKGNYFRIANLLAGLFALHKYFDDVCNWKNPVTTVFYHIVFLILVWYPELWWPLVYLYMFLIGAWNYRFRSRTPPSIDAILSQGGEDPIRDLDELEEEFNVTTSENLKEVLKIRYERLRGFATRTQNFIGEVSTQGERLQSLLSWRDPRATFIFVTFCLIAAIVNYVTPFRVVAQVLIVFYILRHPKFRDPFPSIPLNFFRRLPSLADRIL